MTVSTRPRIAILGRFADHTSATRLSAVVNARRLLEVVWAAGGDPITLLPVEGSNWHERLAGFAGVLMPGGADVDPKRYGQEPASDELYGIDPLQDEVDISLVKYAFEHDLPLLTICRGTQVTNVALGGSLVQHMAEPHRHHVATVTVQEHTLELGLSQPAVSASCYHHQIIDQLGSGVKPIAFATEGHIEAVKYEGLSWGFGVQWHPEDNYGDDAGQLEIVRRFIDEAKSRTASA
ncbi:MAG: gamma-glutamyl-gamma-aminobutyrate hydrolase family protein [Micrococcales bacterium]